MMVVKKGKLSWDDLLLPKQRKIYQELLRINKKAANAYKGALMVLRDRENPDRFSQAAHSLREVSALISREISIPQERKNSNEKRDSNEKLREKLEKRFVENLDLLPRPSEEKVRKLIRVWINLHNDFFISIAHHGKDTSDEEFLSKLSEFEEILLQFLNPAPVVLEELNSLLAISSPSSGDIKRLSELLKHPTYAEYFFSRLSSPDWLIPLKEHGFFDNPPSGIEEGDYVVFPPWPLSRYLTKISRERPREVMNIIKNLQDTDNFRVNVDLIDCALQMPSVIAKEIVPLAKKWINTPYPTFIPQKLGKLVIKFSNENEVKSALELLNALLNIRGVKSHVVANIEFREVLSYLDLWDYKEILSKVVPVVLKKAPYEVVEILCNKLCKAIKLKVANENSSYDSSYIWRPAIEDHPQNTNDENIINLLVTAIRDCLETIGKSNEEALKNCFGLLSKCRYPIFRRIELYLMRVFPGILRSEIQKTLSDKKIFSDIHLWHEYYHLLKEQYPKLPQGIKKCILRWIEEGPNLEKFVFWYKSENKSLPTQKEKNAYKSRWQIKYLSAIKDYVPPEWKKKWRALVAEYGEPAHPDFNSFRIERIGKSSPLTKREIEKMSPREIVNYLKAWKPSDHYSEPSREGLGTILSEVVSETPEKYTRMCQEFKNLHPIYIYYMLNGYREAIQKKNYFDLKSVILFCKSLLISSDVSNSAAEKYWWKMVKMGIVNFIEAGLESPDISFPYELRGTIWEIIEILLQDKEPDLDYEKEYGGDNMDPVTLSLNTVRGKAMHALIQYALWCAQCLNLSEDEDKMTSEVKKWLEKMLNPNIEPTETIRSVYGLYLPTLFYLNKCWVEKHLHDIFPEDGEHRNLWRAAWEAYIIYSNFYCDIYKMLRTQYKAAIDKLNSPRISQIAKEKLSEHLIIAYLWGIEDIDNNSLIRLFFKEPHPEMWAHAMWFVGNALEDLPKGTEDEKKITNRVKNLLEWRIEEIRKLERGKRKDHVHELEWFGMCFTHGFFDGNWMIPQLLNTLELTNGRIKFAGDILDILQDHVRDHYLEILKILSLLTKAEDQGIFIITSEEKIKNLLYIIIKNHPRDEIKDKVNEIIDNLVRKGYHEFANFFIN